MHHTRARLAALAAALDLPEGIGARKIAEHWNDLRVRLGLPARTPPEPGLISTEKELLAIARGLPNDATWNDIFPQGLGSEAARRKMALDARELGHKDVAPERVTVTQYHEMLRAAQQDAGATSPSMPAIRRARRTKR